MDRTNDGRELVDAMLEIARDKDDPKCRLAAIALAASYIWGKPKQSVEVSGHVSTLPELLSQIAAEDAAKRNAIEVQRAHS